MKTKFTFFIRCFIILAMPSIASAQSAQLQPAQIIEGDITTLVVEYVNKIPSLYAIDTSELERDFEVLGVDSRVYRIKEAGQTSNRMQWKIQISPRHTGSLTIPSLKLGDKTTPKLVLQVNPQSTQQRLDEIVTVSLKANQENPYVEQQTDINLRLMHNVDVADGRLFEPEAENVIIFRSGNESSYRERVDGGSFEVVDRPITLFASTPGSLELSPASFRGKISSVSELSTSRTINRYSAPLLLQVREPPVAFTGQHWLPARQIEIIQQWHIESEEPAVGDSIGRQLQIVASGLRSEVLPEDLLLVDNSYFKVYADQAQRQNQFAGKDLTGVLNQHFEIVLTRPGVVEIPDLRMQWWDVEDDIEKVVILPGKTIYVTSGEMAVKSTKDNLSTTEIDYRFFLYLLPVLATLVMIGWFFSGDRGGAKMILRYRQNSLLRTTCFSQDASMVRKGVLDWASSQWPQERIVGLQQIANKINSNELSVELALLDRALYSSSVTDWRGDQLYRLLLQYQHQKRPHQDQSRLPALYPQ